MDRNEDVRLRCFLALDLLRARYGDDLPYAGALDQGFNYGGKRVPFLNRQKGIYKAAAQRGQAAIELPTKPTWHPDRNRLAERFERFLTA